jgi:hypothetical protein
MMIYWFYGRTHSPLADAREQAAQGGAERAGAVVFFAGRALAKSDRTPSAA